MGGGVCPQAGDLYDSDGSTACVVRSRCCADACRDRRQQRRGRPPCYALPDWSRLPPAFPPIEPRSLLSCPTPELEHRLYTFVPICSWSVSPCRSGMGRHEGLRRSLLHPNPTSGVGKAGLLADAIEMIKGEMPMPIWFGRVRDAFNPVNLGAPPRALRTSRRRQKTMRIRKGPAPAFSQFERHPFFASQDSARRLHHRCIEG
jgi:hypothetical protein